MLASVWLDVVFMPLFLSGIETMAPFGAGDGKAYGSAVIHADWTHSLFGALVIAVVFGAVCAIPWGRKLGAVMAAMVFSHWLLDLPMHHHDMPLLPGDAGHLPLMGFGLWSLPALSALLELALVVVGAWLYGCAAIKVVMAEASSVRLRTKRPWPWPRLVWRRSRSMWPGSRLASHDLRVDRPAEMLELAGSVGGLATHIGRVIVNRPGFPGGSQP